MLSRLLSRDENLAGPSRGPHGAAQGSPSRSWLVQAVRRFPAGRSHFSPPPPPFSAFSPLPVSLLGRCSPHACTRRASARPAPGPSSGLRLVPVRFQARGVPPGSGVAVPPAAGSPSSWFTVPPERPRSGGHSDSDGPLCPALATPSAVTLREAWPWRGRRLAVRGLRAAPALSQPGGHRRAARCHGADPGGSAAAWGSRRGDSHPFVPCTVEGPGHGWL